jgi:hypothetical protein
MARDPVTPLELVWMRKAEKWKKFEHLVAALHRSEMKGAIVKWNDDIDGRQFDVTVRFEIGPYKYLTVIECKNYIGAVKAEKVESLITKASDIGADKAVMFSSHGFQSGAKAVAKRHGVSLFSLTQTTVIPDEFLLPQQVEYIHIFDVVLVKADGTSFFLPKEPTKLRYYVKETLVEGSCGNMPVAEIINRHQHHLSGLGFDDVLHYSVDLIPASYVTFPRMERDAPILVRSVQWKMANRVARPLKQRTGLDPGLFIMPYEIRDELCGQVRYVEGDALASGESTSLQTDKFYSVGKVGFYYCDSIDGNVAELIMLESYQHGNFLQAAFKIKFNDVDGFCDITGCGYSEVTDPDEIERLRWRLREFRRKPVAP